jgi:hypothetical protein
MRSIPLAALLTSLTACSFGVWAETTRCTEVVPPVVISHPGSYCLAQDYALNLASQAAIEVTANNVVIDFNGHRIGNMAAGAAQTAAGIRAYGAIQNLTVRNGTVRGFSRGIFLNGNGMGFLIEDMLIDQSLGEGMMIFASNTTLRRNRVQATGSWGDIGTMGIDLEGDNNRVIDNDVVDTKSCSHCVVTGIYVNGQKFVVSDNRVTGLEAGAGSETGIFGVNRGIIRNNVVIDDVLPAGGTGVGIRAITASTVIKIVGNVVDVPGTPYSGGTQVAGTNN